jgi:hypothetical protein
LARAAVLKIIALSVMDSRERLGPHAAQIAVTEAIARPASRLVSGRSVPDLSGNPSMVHSSSSSFGHLCTRRASFGHMYSYSGSTPVNGFFSFTRIVAIDLESDVTWPDAVSKSVSAVRIAWTSLSEDANAPMSSANAAPVMVSACPSDRRFGTL